MPDLAATPCKTKLVSDGRSSAAKSASKPSTSGRYLLIYLPSRHREGRFPFHLPRSGTTSNATVRRGCSLWNGKVPCQKYDGNSTSKPSSGRTDNSASKKGLG